MAEVVSRQNSIVIKLEVTILFEMTVSTSDLSWCQKPRRPINFCHDNL